uniref:Lectin-related protein n=2 Tax=Periplaneta americana TaxID=6978 RepID=P92049_PERAM|nr:lectin-related protein [Periplaneta americana]
MGSTDLQCSSTQADLLNFSITSNKNETGHWVAKVNLKHGDNYGLPLHVNVDHTAVLCERSDSVYIVATISAPPRSPSAGYELLPGLGYYKFHTDYKNWYDARKTCIQEGAHLAVINSETESKALLKLWLPHPKMFNDWRNDWAHIGFHDHYTEGQFVTIFDTPLNEAGFSKWQPPNPDGGDKDDCGVFRRNFGTLGDIPCSAKLAFICEQ